MRELKIQAFLNHPNIVGMYGCFDDKESVYILLEVAPEGQLYSKLKQKERYTEETASFIIKSLLSSVQYMHSKKLLHRDIKPENIVVVHV
jgi:serine/threonine protein kinase